MITRTTAFTKNLTRATMIVAVVAAGITVLPAHADAKKEVRVVQLPTVTVVAKRIPVIELERVVIVAKRLPAAHDRSRSVPRSGMRPTYQKMSETMRYVLIAKMSHTNGLRHCGHTFMTLG